jgi:hypothetical protein
VPSPRIQFRMREALSRGLLSRADYFPGGLSEAASTDLRRYRNLIRTTQARLAREEVFAPEEQAVVLSALNGTLLGGHPEMLVGSVEDSMSLDGTHEEWGACAHALWEKLRGLTPLELAAVADAAEGYWAAVARGEERELRLF